MKGRLLVNLPTNFLKRGSLLTQRNAPADLDQALPATLTAELDNNQFEIGRAEDIDRYLKRIGELDQSVVDLDRRPGKVSISNYGNYDFQGNGYAHLKGTVTLNNENRPEQADLRLSHSLSEAPFRTVRLHTREDGTVERFSQRSEDWLVGQVRYRNHPQWSNEELHFEEKGAVFSRERSSNSFDGSHITVQVTYETKAFDKPFSASECEELTRAMAEAAQTCQETLVPHDGTALDADQRDREDVIISQGGISVSELGPSHGVVRTTDGKVELSFESGETGTRTIRRGGNTEQRSLDVSVWDRTGVDDPNRVSSREWNGWYTKDGHFGFKAKAFMPA